MRNRLLFCDSNNNPPVNNFERIFTPPGDSQSWQKRLCGRVTPGGVAAKWSAAVDATRCCCRLRSCRCINVNHIATSIHLRIQCISAALEGRRAEGAAARVALPEGLLAGKTYFPGSERERRRRQWRIWRDAHGENAVACYFSYSTICVSEPGSEREQKRGRRWLAQDKYYCALCVLLKCPAGF